MKFLANDKLQELVAALNKDYLVFFPVKKGEQRYYKKYTDSLDGVVLGEVRAFEPLKAFFSRAREVVAEDFQSNVPHQKDKPLAILGVKACDLKGFKVQDHVFKDHDYEDPFYIKNRNENLVISCDCTCAINTCFCTALGIKPYPEEGFDLNLSPVTDGYLVTAGSKKGEELLAQNGSLFSETGNSVEDEQRNTRVNVTKAVDENIKENDVPRQDSYKNIIEKNFEADIWADEAKTCVECAACNVICPTCHCFLLYDQKSEKKMERLRIWDSCMVKDFARVAGDANPRAKLWMRLRNRFEKKFDYFPKVADVYACTGCGRCISACPAKKTS